MPDIPLRIGLIGVEHRARMASNWHDDPRAQIVAGCDIDDEFLGRFQEKHKDTFTCNDYRDLVARDDVDAVGVFTRDNLHAEHAVAALEAGKHVFCEKPMAIHTEDCDRMLEAWRQSGTRFMVGMNMRYMDNFIALKDVIDSGQIGEVKAVWVRHFVGFGGFAYFHDYRANSKGSTGLLLQKASHDFDMIHFLTGRYTKRVTGMGSLDFFGGDKPNDLVCEDCDDADASAGNTGTFVADDADCDGVLTADDCDDSDDLVMELEEEVEVHVALDTGSVAHCAGPKDIPGSVRVKPPASGKVRNFVGAGGDGIKCHGEALVQLMQDNGNVIDTTFQVADVVRPLHSASQICDGTEERHHEVLFTREAAHVVPEGTLSRFLASVNVIAKYPRRGGLYVAKMKARRPRPKPSSASRSSFARPGRRS